MFSLRQSIQGNAGTPTAVVTTLVLTFASPTVAGNCIIVSANVGAATSPKEPR
jgi:hypothetical protein